MLILVTRLALSAYARQLGKRPTVKQKLKLEERRSRLQTCIESFQSKAQIYSGKEDTNKYYNDTEWDIDDGPYWDNYQDSDEEDGSEDGLPTHSQNNPFLVPSNAVDINVPEKIRLLLPSNIDNTAFTSIGLKQLAKKELSFREGQANDALHQIQIALGHKSLLFRTKIRVNKSQKHKTRAWDKVHLVESTVQHQARIYTSARQAIIKLGANRSALDRYQVLKQEDLKAGTFLVNPSLPGTRHSKLAWFWSMDIQKDNDSSSWMQECKRSVYFTHGATTKYSIVYRVHWLRAKAWFDRWKEESVLVPSEMDWTVRFFKHKAGQWTDRRSKAVADGLPGHACYAARQEAMWNKFAVQAQEQFDKVTTV